MVVTGAVMVFSAPGVQKWYSLGYKYGNARRTNDPDEIAKMKAAVEEDMTACTYTTCGTRAFAPTHYTGHFNDTEAITYHCRSWSRWYNPDTGKMEGHAHCTCDGCF